MKLKEILERDYYVPDVSELCIGFEYSYKTDVIEHRAIENKYDLEFTFGLHLDNNLFVKKLDVEDIKSLGFRDISLPQSICPVFIKKFVGILLDTEVVIINDIDVVFRGKIKNKTELQKILKQVGQ